MKPDVRATAAIALGLSSLAVAPSAVAIPGGQIGTLPTGRFQCDKPGGADGMQRLRVPEEDFEAVTASSYVVAGERGTYLLTGDRLVMSSGPFKGKRYHRTSYGYLRIVLPDGTDAPVRCVLIQGS